MEVTGKGRFPPFAFRFSVVNALGLRVAEVGTRPPLVQKSLLKSERRRAKTGSHDICHSRALTIATTGQPAHDRSSLLCWEAHGTGENDVHRTSIASDTSPRPSGRS